MTNDNPNYFESGAPSVGYTLADIFESVSGNLDKGILDWAAPSYQLLQNDPQFKVAGLPVSSEPDGYQGAAPAEKDDSFLGRASSWLKNNKELAHLGGGILAGIASDHSKQEQIKSQAEARMAELRAQDEMKQADNARYSASVSGLRSPGLIGKQMALKRINGTAIYNNGKLAGG
jgi:hypothetical protein